ncbi:hypothetical protein [Lichenicoccus sp.]|uniref:hypothetical protein n=1 Tax=Lichenicoccus sp. TaxID=2781899 RepID=UPI003D098A89
MNPAVPALFGSVATAIAIFGGGLAVELFRHRRARIGMALALAGAIDALLHLVEARDISGKLATMHDDFEAGRPVRSAPVMGPNQPFQTITEAYAGDLGNLGGDLPFRVARFVTHSYGIQLDLLRLSGDADDVKIKLALIREIGTLWQETSAVGQALVADLRSVAGLGAVAGLSAPPPRDAAPDSHDRRTAPEPPRSD